MPVDGPPPSCGCPECRISSLSIMKSPSKSHWEMSRFWSQLVPENVLIIASLANSLTPPESAPVSLSASESVPQWDSAYGDAQVSPTIVVVNWESPPLISEMYCCAELWPSNRCPSWELGKGFAGKLTLSTGQNSPSASPTNGLSSVFLVSTVDNTASFTYSEYMYTSEDDNNSIVTERIRKILLGVVLLTPSGR